MSIGYTFNTPVTFNLPAQGGVYFLTPEATSPVATFGGSITPLEHGGIHVNFIGSFSRRDALLLTAVTGQLDTSRTTDACAPIILGARYMNSQRAQGFPDGANVHAVRYQKADGTYRTALLVTTDGIWIKRGETMVGLFDLIDSLQRRIEDLERVA